MNDPASRTILEALRAGPRTAGEIAEQLEFPAPTISNHLDLLRQADLISSY